MRLDGNVPAVVRSTSWKEYVVSTERPVNFVVVFVAALGMDASRCEFLYISRERSLAVASLSGGHSNVTEVCVTLRTCKMCEDTCQGESKRHGTSS